MMYEYQPLSGTKGFDFRSSFTFSGQKRAPNTETEYTAISLNMPSMQYMRPSQSWIDYFCTTTVKIFAYALFVLTFPFSALVCLKLAHQYERIVMYRLGRLAPLKGPGIVLVLPCIDRWKKVDLRTRAFNIPPTRLRTTDGCLVLVGGVIHFRVQNPLLTSNSVQDVNHSIRVAAQSVMSTTLSKKKLPELMSNRTRYSYDIQSGINEVARDWGLEVGRVELTQPTVEVNPAAGVSPGAPSLPPQLGLGDGAMQGFAQLAQHFMSNQSAGASKQADDESSPEELEDAAAAATDLLNAVHMFLTEELVMKIGATYEVRLKDSGAVFYMDLKNGGGSCGEGNLPGGGDPDVKLTASLKALKQLLSGKMGPFQAYTSGRLQVEGDIKKAMKLDELVQCLRC